MFAKKPTGAREAKPSGYSVEASTPLPPFPLRRLQPLPLVPAGCSQGAGIPLQSGREEAAGCREELASAAEHPSRTWPSSPTCPWCPGPPLLSRTSPPWPSFSPRTVRLQEAEVPSRMTPPSSHAALRLRILPAAPTPSGRGIRRQRFETQSPTRR